MSTDRDRLRDVLAALDRLGLEALNEDGRGAVCYGPPTLLALRDAARRALQHLTSTVEPVCSCGTPGLDYEGPEVDCDVHGSPSAAFDAGRREGAQDERDQARIRGDLCRWCLREPQRGERHGDSVPGGDGHDPEVVCLDASDAILLHSSADEDPFDLPEPVTVPARDAARRERAAYAAGRASGAGASP